MKPLTAEWVAKGEGDLAVALRERRARKTSNYDAACFHAQQCAEKYLKAVLQEESIAFPRTHDLERLLNMVLPLEPGWSILSADLIQLSVAAVELRYPGNDATKAEATQALRICQRFARGYGPGWDCQCDLQSGTGCLATRCARAGERDDNIKRLQS